jgi:hypothetical protein
MLVAFALWLQEEAVGSQEEDEEELARLRSRIQAL